MREPKCGLVVLSLGSGWGRAGTGGICPAWEVSVTHCQQECHFFLDGCSIPTWLAQENLSHEKCPQDIAAHRVVILGGVWLSLQKLSSGKWLEFIAVDVDTTSGFNKSVLTSNLSTGYSCLLLIERQKATQISQVMTLLFITYSSCLKGQQPAVCDKLLGKDRERKD